MLSRGRGPPQEYNAASAFFEGNWKRLPGIGLFSRKVMGRSEWLTVGITLLTVWLTCYLGQGKAAVACGVAGALILAAILFSRRGGKDSELPSPTVSKPLARRYADSKSDDQCKLG